MSLFDVFIAMSMIVEILFFVALIFCMVYSIVQIFKEENRKNGKHR